MTKLVKFDQIPQLSNYHMPFRYGSQFMLRADPKYQSLEIRLEKKDKAGRRHVNWTSIEKEGVVALWAGLDQFVREHGLDKMVETKVEYEERIRENNRQSEESGLAHLWED